MNKLLNWAFVPVDWILNWPNKDKNPFLNGIHAPVEEATAGAVECEVIGTLPDGVLGEFARNGPNPKFDPNAGYHWFDGDGMVHAVRLKRGGKATYSNKYVRTKRLQLEEAAGKSLFFKIGDMSGLFALPKVLTWILKTKLGLLPDMRAEGESTANTSLLYHAGRMLALGEGGMPYALRVLCDGVMETIGKVSYSEFNGGITENFTAHPKLDRATGKLYGFGYNMEVAPFVTLYVIDAQGEMERKIPLDMKRGVMMHDMAFTDKHMIFLDLPLVLEGGQMLKGQMPLVFDKTAEARMAVLPIDATDSSDMKWFVLPETFYTFHVLNAFEEDDGKLIKIISCDYYDLKFDLVSGDLANNPDQRATPVETTLNMVTGEATRRRLLPSPPTLFLEFPQIRQSLLGRQTRFGYAVVVDTFGSSTGLVKLDLRAASPETAVIGRVDHGEGWVGGEAVFIPAKPGVSAEGSEEDDGFLATFVSPRNGGTSELRVWDAKTMAQEPVAVVMLPARVPMGFHALFVSEAELAIQAA